MKKIISVYFRYLFFVILVFALLIYATTFNKENVLYVSNSNYVKSIKYDNLSSNVNLRVDDTNLVVDSFNDILIKKVGSTFSGNLTGYGPNCEGCGGFSGCRPRTDFRNGNILFPDKEYGKIRVVAADRNIPCGTIIDVHLPNGNKFPAIVMDRGGAIKKGHLDLLFNSEKETDDFGNVRGVKFSIVRWGW